VLSGARKLTGAEAGTLYVLCDGRLRCQAAQNDKLPTGSVTKLLTGGSVGLDDDSLLVSVVRSRRVVNVPDCDQLKADDRSRINKTYAPVPGYRALNLLVAPLICPDGDCVAVLELANHLSAEGFPSAFGEGAVTAIRSMAPVAAIAIRSSLSQAQLRCSHYEMMVGLAAAAEYPDSSAAGHVRRVSYVSSLIAEALGFDSGRVDMLKYASLMHDIGKIVLRHEDYDAEGPLSPQQRRASERHTVVGAKILSHLDGELYDLAGQIALTHHERWDGSGYPRRLKGTEIPIEGRIVGLADVFDSLVSDRPYKQRYPIDVGAYVLRRQQGRGFDPRVLRAFFDAFDEIIVPYAEI